MKTNVTRAELQYHHSTLARYVKTTSCVYADVLVDILDHEKNLKAYLNAMIEVMDDDDLIDGGGSERAEAIQDIKIRATEVLRILRHINTEMPGNTPDVPQGELPNGPAITGVYTVQNIPRNLAVVPLNQRLMVLSQVLGLDYAIDNPVTTGVVKKQDASAFQNVLNKIEKHRPKGAGEHRVKCKHMGLKFMLTDVSDTEFHITLRKESTQP